MNYSKFLNLFIFTLFLFSCENKNEDVFSAVFTDGELAQATILSVTDIKDTSAIVVCALSSKGKGYISARGVCWATTPNPTTETAHTATKDTGNIAMKLTKLILGTKYYVRPYITNTVGTSYGTMYYFITKNIPTITTTSITNLTTVSATLGVEVTADGGDSVTVRGVCWGTSTKPTTALTTKTTNGAGKGVFVSQITGLTIGTTYYARAYATNVFGTVYGNEIKFTTQNLPTITTTAVTNVTSVTATSGGTITGEGGSTVIARGICWSTTQNPTIDLTTKTVEGIGLTSFTSTMVNLQLGTTYYVRAYATNSLGTSYGAQQTFTTNNYSTITTNAVTNITATTATCGGNISSDGGSAVTERGVCWSTSTDPTISLTTKTTNGSGTGIFTSSLTGLAPNTTYYVRAFATNTVGTVYGTVMSFTTNSLSLPTLTTNTPTTITTNSASSGGNITDDGGANIAFRGVCWSTSPTPTIANSKTSDGTGNGAFTSSITGLTPGTTYYLRAYSTNTVGTAYGNEVTFTTVSLSIPTITTNAVTNIFSTTATSGGNITYDGGATVTARGVCWSTSSTPTIANNKTSDGTSTGSFSSSITGLTAITTYYVRAYATNAVGTAYGAEVSFKTLATPVGITDMDGNVYTSVTIGTQTWMVENLKTTKYNDGTAIPLVTDGTAWSNLTTAAYCWYNNDAATNKNTYGALYNWYAVITGKLAPTGWHVATDAEWTTLESYVSTHLGASGSIAKALAAKTNWQTYTGTGTIGDNLTINNSSGFTALPGGYRGGSGTYYVIGDYGDWWSSSENGTTSAWDRNLGYDDGGLYRYYPTKSYGFSVRCVRDY